MYSRYTIQFNLLAFGCCHLSNSYGDAVHIKDEKHKRSVVRVSVRECIPCTASWDRSECKSPGSSITAWGTVSAAAW